MNYSLPDIGRVTTSQIGGLGIHLAHGGRSDGIPILLTSPWPESIYAFRGILPAIKELGPLILVDLPGFGRSGGRPDVMSPEAMEWHSRSESTGPHTAPTSKRTTATSWRNDSIHASLSRDVLDTPWDNL